MPWQFTTPIPVDTSLDPLGNLTHCRIHLRDNDPDRQRMLCTISYGRIPDTDYVPSQLHPADAEMSMTISGQDWVDLVANSEPEAGEKTYAAAKRALYEYAATNSVIAAGTVV